MEQDVTRNEVTVVNPVKGPPVLTAEGVWDQLRELKVESLKVRIQLAPVTFQG